MRLQIGDKITFKDTGEKGFIIDILENGQLLVDVDGLGIPVKADDLVRDRSNTPSTQPAVPKTENNESAAKQQKATQSITGTGIYLAFLPTHNAEGEISNFQVYLVNDFDVKVQFQVAFFLRNDQQFKLNKSLPAREGFFLAEINFGEINDQPKFNFSVSLTEKGSVTKTIKPKGKALLREPQIIPVLQKRGYLFEVCQTFTNKQVEELSEENKKRTSIDKDELIRQMFEDKQENHHQKRQHTPPEYKVDLHIEQLVKDSSYLSNAEIVKIQLRRCEKAVEQALIRNQASLIIIHGVGKGKLRQEVHSLLACYPGVKSYKNEYHPLYGFGATFVEF